MRLLLAQRCSSSQLINLLPEPNWPIGVVENAEITLIKQQRNNISYYNKFLEP
jgi:hypothetical protein